MFARILVANRGEIACRVMRTARRMGVETVAVYSDVDRGALHTREADQAIHIGPPPATESYIATDRVLAAAVESGAEAIHPGYGFLSENAAFAEACSKQGIRFIGPPASAIRAMGDKIASKKIASEAGVSTIPGFLGVIQDAEEATRISSAVGYPVMIKASAGGGGKGMRVAHDEQGAREGFLAAQNEAHSSFGDDRIFIEKFITRPRHIEIQILADAYGNTLWLNERECSIQRRNQKVVEEAPSPFLDQDTRMRMGNQACALGRAVGYQSAGTVEFIVDEQRNFYFLEMNTRLQVEHPVTELITGVDLVEQMLRIAAGEKLTLTQDDVAINGHAIEGRVYAENPFRRFLPSTGRLTRYRPPAEQKREDMALRNDSGVFEGATISPHYDPMIAKLCIWGPTRQQAITHMQQAIDKFVIDGINHNLPFLAALMAHKRFVAADINTAFIEEEYPDGFNGASLESNKLRQLAACAVIMHVAAEKRRFTGAKRPFSRGVIESTWSVRLDSHEHEVTLDSSGEQSRVTFADGALMTLSVDWAFGDTLVNARVGEETLVFQAKRRGADGFTIRYRGAEFEAAVRTPRIAQLEQLMPVKTPPDTSNLLLCPMPGLLVRLMVGEGDEVEAGQALCTVEAMKMENTLRSVRNGTIGRICVEPGDILAADQIILEYS